MNHKLLVVIVLSMTAYLCSLVAGGLWLFDGCPDIQHVNALPDPLRSWVSDWYWPIGYSLLGAALLGSFAFPFLLVKRVDARLALAREDKRTPHRRST